LLVESTYSSAAQRIADAIRAAGGVKRAGDIIETVFDRRRHG
jgi:UDP:flavonoid glycosyltransferase YjiC (YdhE family)